MRTPFARLRLASGIPGERSETRDLHLPSGIGIDLNLE